MESSRSGSAAAGGRGYRIYRTSYESHDPTANLRFEPDQDSDELFEALKRAFPNGKKHKARMRDALIQFLIEEQEQERCSESAPSTAFSSAFIQSTSTTIATEAAYVPFPAPEWSRPQGTPRSFSQDSGGHSEVHPTATSMSPPTTAVSHPPFTTLAAPWPESSVPPAAEGVMSAPAPPQPEPKGLKHMTSTWSISSAQVRENKRRKMTERERSEYRVKRAQGACKVCKKGKRKCTHPAESLSESISRVTGLERSRQQKPKGRLANPADCLVSRGNSTGLSATQPESTSDNATPDSSQDSRNRSQSEDTSKDAGGTPITDPSSDQLLGDPDIAQYFRFDSPEAEAPAAKPESAAKPLAEQSPLPFDWDLTKPLTAEQQAELPPGDIDYAAMLSLGGFNQDFASPSWDSHLVEGDGSASPLGEAETDEAEYRERANQSHVRPEANAFALPFLQQLAVEGRTDAYNIVSPASAAYSRQSEDAMPPAAAPALQMAQSVVLEPPQAPFQGVHNLFQAGGDEFLAVGSVAGARQIAQDHPPASEPEAPALMSQASNFGPSSDADIWALQPSGEKISKRAKSKKSKKASVASEMADPTHSDKAEGSAVASAATKSQEEDPADVPVPQPVLMSSKVPRSPASPDPGSPSLFSRRDFQDPVLYDPAIEYTAPSPPAGPPIQAPIAPTHVGPSDYWDDDLAYGDWYDPEAFSARPDRPPRPHGHIVHQEAASSTNYDVSQPVMAARRVRKFGGVFHTPRAILASRKASAKKSVELESAAAACAAIPSTSSLGDPAERRRESDSAGCASQFTCAEPQVKKEPDEPPARRLRQPNWTQAILPKMFISKAIKGNAAVHFTLRLIASFTLRLIANLKHVYKKMMPPSFHNLTLPTMTSANLRAS
ncbi:hypothetical protein BDY21DRAFT_370718 [Lineolata rhizophorae]|uniref:Uncharacterized protein n=1 Tax=Lineolata rhizophorae TaxID=578093 RepID=A0A6A6P399_9PEZI|nr:hypothetical protein BDY21DRAFT_370718 [Lineolata rhizophorae]